MKHSKTTVLIAFSTLLTITSMGQGTNSIGDKVKRKDKVEILTATSIQEPFARFIEKQFILNISKADLLKATKETAALFDKDEVEMMEMMNKIVNYLDTCSNLTFEYIWTEKDDQYDSSWTDVKNIRTLTEKYLREGVCSMIENKRILIETKTADKDKFYLTGVATKFGYAKGVFTTDDRLIWICPPITVD